MTVQGRKCNMVVCKIVLFHLLQRLNHIDIDGPKRACRVWIWVIMKGSWVLGRMVLHSSRCHRDVPLKETRKWLFKSLQHIRTYHVCQCGWMCCLCRKAFLSCTDVLEACVLCIRGSSGVVTSPRFLSLAGPTYWGRFPQTLQLLLIVLPMVDFLGWQLDWSVCGSLSCVPLPVPI